MPTQVIHCVRDGILKGGNCRCRLGLIPLVSTAVHHMKGPFDDIGEKDFTDVELSLHVLCTSDDTQDVTSNDFILDHQHPEVYPVGNASRKHITPCSRAIPTMYQCR